MLYIQIMYTNVRMLKIYFDLSLPIFTYTQAYLKVSELIARTETVSSTAFCH